MNLLTAPLGVFVVLGLFSAPVGVTAQQVGDQGRQGPSSTTLQGSNVIDPCRGMSEEEKRRHLALQSPPPPPGLSCPGGTYWNGKGCTSCSCSEIEGRGKRDHSCSAP
jgi:hypothetical protein